MTQSNSQAPNSGWWLKALGVAVLCLVSGVLGGALTRNFGTSSYSLSYADFISIMLTAVSLLMTVLAIFLAVFGVIGWNAIQGRVHQRTEEFLNEGFKEGRPLYQMLETRATEIIYEGIIPVVGAEDDEENKEDGEE
ncbi:hypothetical protein GCM10023264_08990 [Sphingomonas daechungensis]|uniref:hypothetical protein n=1 Tax=Sphingomonas daechungensis TaxID=1176646 RepID=UPI0031E4FF96